jgi:hypothetical protein
MERDSTRAKNSSLSDNLLAPLHVLSAQWRERAKALTDDREVMRDDRVKARAIRECADALDTVVARLLSQQIENKEDDPRVGPSVPCVERIGSTADGGPGVQSSPAPEHAPCSFCDLSIYETWPTIERTCPDGRVVAICQACAVELAQALSPGSVESDDSQPYIVRDQFNIIARFTYEGQAQLFALEGEGWSVDGVASPLQGPTPQEAHEEKVGSRLPEP